MKPWLIILLCVVGGFFLLIFLKNLLFRNPDMRNDDSVLDTGQVDGWFGVVLDFLWYWFWW
ncbi:MAG TPA: hypothetical protein VGL56_21360 [Fimbriimonadaceae bacterium]